MNAPLKAHLALANLRQDLRDFVLRHRNARVEIDRLNSRLGRMEIDQGDFLDVMQSQAETILADQLEIDRLRAMVAHPAAVNAEFDPSWFEQMDEIRNLPEHRLV